MNSQIIESGVLVPHDHFTLIATDERRNEDGGSRMWVLKLPENVRMLHYEGDYLTKEQEIEIYKACTGIQPYHNDGHGRWFAGQPIIMEYTRYIIVTQYAGMDV